LHEYTLVLALRLGELPSTPLPLFNGGAPPPQGDKVSYIILPQRLQLQPALPMRWLQPHATAPCYSPMLQPHAGDTGAARMLSLTLSLTLTRSRACNSTRMAAWVHSTTWARRRLRHINPHPHPNPNPNPHPNPNPNPNPNPDPSPEYMRTQEAAVHADRWSWVVVTRKPGELRTYLNGLYVRVRVTLT
jgi:hypothetical protein